MHMEELWSSERLSSPIIIPDSAVQAAYVGVTGEEGACLQSGHRRPMTMVARSWMFSTGGSRTVSAAVRSTLMPRSLRATTPISRPVFICLAGVYIGVQLPLTAERQVEAGQPWSVVSTTGQGSPGSWGGHAVPCVGFDANTLTCVTWGALQTMTWEWFNTYCDEAYACLAPDWFTNGHIFNQAALLADAQAIAA